MARFLPGSTSLRPFLHRLRGVKIHGRVFIGDDVYLENEFPEHVEIRNGAAILLRSTIIAHTNGPGKLTIEENVLIGAGCTVVCSPGQRLTIGHGSVISAGSVVQHSIPAETLCAGPRIQAVARITVPYNLAPSHRDFVRGLKPLGARSTAAD